MTSRFAVIRDSTPKTAIPKGAVVAMGNFDGVHLGHRAVIMAALEMARAHGRPAFAVTFEPHPRSFFSPNTPQFRLTDEANKLRLLAGAGLAGAVVMAFDKARAGTLAQDFIHHDLIDRLGISGTASMRRAWSAVRDATGAQYRNVGEWLLAIADQQSDETPSSRVKQKYHSLNGIRDGRTSHLIPCSSATR